MRLLKCLSAMLLAAELLFAAPMTAYAHDVPDASQKGTIAITMRYDGKPVSGGSLTLYRAAEVKEDDGNYSFALTGDFTASGAELTDISSADLAGDLARFAASRKLTGTTRKIGSDGKVSFTGLELGLYLLVQDEAAEGYNKAEPFLVSVPMMEDGAYRYEVNATPKVELEKAPPKPMTPDGSKLPQTGQLNWPVPVLVVLGLCLFSAGWVLRFGKKNSGYEK